MSKYFGEDFKPLDIGTEISSFAYPETVKEMKKDNHIEFTFNGINSQGKIHDLNKEGALR